ncbi:MAG: hypothetical protein MK102_04705 [Fuerstiella sp.]|nr:hypothetical protein [Fuerstiella sp.]
MFGKTLLVFTAVVSVLLAGVSMVAYFAVPSMAPAMAELADYSFERKNVGKTVRWDVSHRLRDQESVAANKTIFEAVVAATNDAKTKLQTESNAATTLLASVNEQLEQHKAEQTQDVDAMTRRGKDLLLGAEKSLTRVTDESGTFQGLSVEATEVRNETSSRRQDVTRLREELEELRTHDFELQKLERTLTDQLLRVQLDIQTLQLRADQVRQQLNAD